MTPLLATQCVNKAFKPVKTGDESMTPALHQLARKLSDNKAPMPASFRPSLIVQQMSHHDFALILV